MKTHHLQLITEFTDAPGGRYKWQGEFSGEEFREDYLLPKLQEGDQVVVDLNGALGLPSSFLDEAFGEVARIHPQFMSQLKIELEDNVVAKRILEKMIRGTPTA